jgi:hypothetical protein
MTRVFRVAANSFFPGHGFAQDPRRAERGALEVDEEPVEHSAARLDAFQEGLQHCRMPVQP